MSCGRAVARRALLVAAALLLGVSSASAACRNARALLQGGGIEECCGGLGPYLCPRDGRAYYFCYDGPAQGGCQPVSDGPFPTSACLAQCATFSGPAPPAPPPSPPAPVPPPSYGWCNKGGVWQGTGLPPGPQTFYCSNYGVGPGDQPSGLQYVCLDNYACSSTPWTAENCTSASQQCTMQYGAIDGGATVYVGGVDCDDTPPGKNARSICGQGPGIPLPSYICMDMLNGGGCNHWPLTAGFYFNQACGAGVCVLPP